MSRECRTREEGPTSAGRSVVVIAKGAYVSAQYALKFFAIRADYDADVAARSSGPLAAIAPRMLNLHDPRQPPRRNIAITDSSDRPLPPCIVMPAGESLVRWNRRASPDIFQAASVRSR